MIHDIDIVTSLVKKKIKKISAFGKKIITNSIDIANVRIEFTDDCVANLTSSRISQKNERKILPGQFQANRTRKVVFRKAI